MKEEIKNLWVEALRSGEYTQGRGSLKFIRKDGRICHCALGVLVQIASDCGVDVQERLCVNTWEFDGRDITLPDVVLRWSGVSDPYGKFLRRNGLRDSIASLNDVDEFSFSDLAGIIEENF